MTTTTKSGIWGPAEAAKNGYPHNELLISKLANVFTKQQVIRDFGCGDAYYIAHLEKSGFKVFGYDGFIPDTCHIPHLCTTMDLSVRRPFTLRGQVLSLEVGEHIAAEHEDAFLDNLADCCASRMVLSWAIPGQGGIGHVNCRDNGYIVQKMNARGFVHNSELSDYLRKDTPMEVRYFENTLMVFDRL